MTSTETLPMAGTITCIEIALVIFMVVFVGIVMWVTFSRSEHFRRAARIPLDDETVVTPRNTSDSPKTPGADRGSVTER